MRVYLPTTLAAIPALLAERRLPGGPGCAVTPALREWYAEGDEEQLEYVALQRAARMSLDLLADVVRAPRRRVVIAVDLPAEIVSPVPEDHPSEVVVDGDITMSDIQAVHVDHPAAKPLVRAALEQPDDEVVQEDLEDVELLWYATQELEALDLS